MMLKKVFGAVSSAFALGLIFLSQVTISGATVSLEAGELSSLGTGLAEGGSSLLNIVISLFPYLLALTVILLVFRWIKRMAKLKTN